MASPSRLRRLLPALAAALLRPHAPLAVDAAPTLDEALLSDLLAGYATHAPSDCASPDLDSRTTFTFDYPGVRTESEWDPDVEGFEESLFSALMRHEDANGRDWEIRVGTSGNVYSAFARGMEATSPQRYEAPWVDEVDQIVSVNNQLNGETRLARDPCDYDAGECEDYFVHQAGAYRRDDPYTTDPVYSPSLARHCAGNSCAFASWGTQAHLPTPFLSHVVYVTRFTNCGDGVIEHTQMIHNFANPQTSDPFEVDQDYFNVGWGGVRTTSYPFALEPSKSGALTYGDAQNVNDVDYLPLCRWGVDAEGTSGPAGRAAIKSLSSLGGYTTFVGDGLIVNRTTPELRTACRKPGASCNGNRAKTCMVDTCTAEMVEDGYVPLRLGVRRATGPKCLLYTPANPYGGYVQVKCDFLLAKGFGQTTPYMSDPDPCAPWRDSRIGFYNTRTGATMEVAQVRHWSWSSRSYRIYFSTFFEDTGPESQQAAVDYVSAMFAKDDRVSSYDIELRTVYMSPVKPWCRKPDVSCDADPATCMVPSCTDSSRYTRIALGVPPQGPDCQFYDTAHPYQGLVTLQCNLRLSTGFGFTDVDKDHPPIGLWNTVNGKTLEVPNVKHWSINHDDHKVYFSVNFVDDGEGGSNRALAIDHVNAMFANSGVAVPIEIRSLSTSGLEREVPASYDPAPLPAFTYVYGKGERYDSGAVSGWSRRRIGSALDTRRYTAFTINWLGSARLRAGDTYVNRGFKFTSDLGSVQATATDLTSKVYIDEVGLEQWSPRKIDIYQSDSRFAVIAAAEAEGDSTSCSAMSSPPVCSGTSTPRNGHTPFFHVACGAESYLGPNPYHFTPPFDYCILVQTDPTSAAQGLVGILVNSNDGQGYVQVNDGGPYDANEVVYDHCFADLVGVQVKPESRNNWVGTVKVSTDHKLSYSSLPCDNCGGEKNMVESITVDEDSWQTGAAPTSCCGKTELCTMPVRLPYCVLVQTSFEQHSDGDLDVWIDSGDGFSAVRSGIYGQGKVVLDKCYQRLVGVQVRNPSNNSWVGDILVSTDGKVTYSSLTCDDCDSPVTHSSPIIVDGDGGGSTTTTECIGKTCTLTYRHACLRVTTGSTSDSPGYLDVFVNSGDGRGFVQVNSNQRYSADYRVVHQCFANLVAIQVKGHSDDAWQGSIETSYDDGELYSPLVVNEEGNWEGTTSTTDSIVVSSDSTNDLATTKCLNGNICTLPIRPLCLLITTHNSHYNQGSAMFSVDSGNGYVEVESGDHSPSETIVDLCYNNIVGIKVQGQYYEHGSWVGSILLSSDNKKSYHPLECQGCTGTKSTASLAVVDANHILDSPASTQCIAGTECEISVHKHSTERFVRSYACKQEGVFVRPSWKLMGFFDSSDPGCAGLSTSSYDQTACTSQ